MAVLGHACIGLAVGVASAPPTPRPPEGGESLASGAATAPARLIHYWLPLAVALAYFPDIAAQALTIIRLPATREWSHSLVCALAAAGLSGLAVPLLRRRLFLLVFVSLSVHDLVDLLHATERVPFWPLADLALGSDWPGLPAPNSLLEGLAYGGASVIFLAARGLFRRRQRRLSLASGTRPFTVALVAAIVVLACGVHLLRDARERALERARVALARGSWNEALTLAEAADRWPSAARPGRVAYIRAEAHAAQGDRKRAEEEYRESWKADRAYFWALADLTRLLAAADKPLEERRREVEPYLRRLRSDFPDHPQLASTLERLERDLRRPR